MALVLHATVVTMDDARPVVPAGRVCVGDDGRIEAVLGRGEREPAGYGSAARVSRGGVLCPGLIDLHNHLAFNAIPLWVPPRDTPYPTRYSWSGTARYRREVYLPAVIQGLGAGKALLKYAEVKAVVGGATATQGSAKLSKPYEGWLIRNVEDETFGKGPRFDMVRQNVLPLRDSQLDNVREALVAGKRFLYHLSEGASDALRKEYVQLRDGQLLHPGLVGIHSTALTPGDFREWSGVSPGSVVWSPLSNLLLYGRTTDVLAAMAAGHTVALGADWSPTGSKNLLGELKVADLVNRSQLGGVLTRRQLLAMATRNGAAALGWTDQVGTIAPGLLADLLLTARRDDEPHSSVVSATERDVTLVTVGGRPVYGTGAAMRDAGAAGAEPLALGRLRRAVALVDAAVPDADMTWPQVLSALAATQSAPRELGGLPVAAPAPGERAVPAGIPEWLRGWDGTFDADGLPTLVRSRSGPGEAEPLYVLPDLPPVLDADPDVPAARAVDPAELADVVVPPADSLLTDDVFVETLRRSVIPGRALDGLADYWP